MNKHLERVNPVKSSKYIPCCLLFILMIKASFPVYSQDASLIQETYVKKEYRIEMRDGVKLHTIVYAPVDSSETYPILLYRTPYSIRPYGDEMRASLSTNEWLARDRYIFVFQDVRGKFMSGGQYVNMRPVLDVYNSSADIDETTDTWDTVDWLVKNIGNNNGKVGMYGVSYPGFYTVMGTINAHPAMVCTSPQAPISDWFLMAPLISGTSYWNILIMIGSGNP